MQVIAIRWLVDRFEAEFVRCPVANSAFDSAAREPCREGSRVVISPQRFTSLGRRLSAKLGRADHERVVEHPLLFEILEQRRCSGV